MKTEIKQWLEKMGYDKNMPFTMTIENLAHTIEAYASQPKDQLDSALEKLPTEDEIEVRIKGGVNISPLERFIYNHEPSDKNEKKTFRTQLLNCFQPQPQDSPKVRTFEALFAEHQKWAEEKFPESTVRSSLKGLKREIKEVEKEIKKLEALPDGDDGIEDLELEYVDCFMYLLDSMNRAGISLNDFEEAFTTKLFINQERVWKKNKDNSYSHKK